MQFHRGRLIDHIHLRARDLAKTIAFYRAVIPTVSPDAKIDADDRHLSCDELWIDKADGPVSRVHFAFQAADRATVDRFHAAALAAGGADNGKPGERPYHPGYYAAFVLDPDGNNIEAVFHGPMRRSADSVVITPA